MSTSRTCARTSPTPDIGLTNLYGLHADVTRQLRTLEAGLFKSQQINGEEFPLYVGKNGEVSRSSR